jgi:hypothetical protein
MGRKDMAKVYLAALIVPMLALPAFAAHVRVLPKPLLSAPTILAKNKAEKEVTGENKAQVCRPPAKTATENRAHRAPSCLKSRPILM